MPVQDTLPLAVAADLQDHLLVAGHDLDRLHKLLHDAGDTLLGHFTLANQQLAGDTPEAARRSIGAAVTALQFQDMASQLIHHTAQRLRGCADRLARDAMQDHDEDGDAVVIELPQRPNPVTQDEMDAGSIELF